MAQLDQTFNSADVPEDDRSFNPLPPGEYAMQVIDSELKATKANNGDQQLVLTLEVIEGALTNRRVWDRLNIRHHNADTQRIAQRGLADLCEAVGIQSLRNTEDLHFKPFTGKIRIREDKKGEYGPQNSVRYKPRGGAPSRSTHVPQSMQARDPNPSSARQTQNGGAPTDRQRPAAGAKPWLQKATA